MNPLPIPEYQYPALAKLRALPEATLEELKAALSSAPLKFYEADLAAYLEPKTSLAKDDLRDVVRVLAALSVVRMLSEMPIDTFAESIAESMSLTGRSDLRLDSDSAKRFKAALRSLLEFRAIAVPAKTKSLLRSFDNVICRARTLTDLRPVFADEATQMDAAVVVHSLNISYHHGAQLRDFFVALDSDDLDRLIEVLQRAKAKAGTLKAVVSPASIPIIDIERG